MMIPLKVYPRDGRMPWSGQIWSYTLRNVVPNIWKSLSNSQQSKFLSSDLGEYSGAYFHIYIIFNKMEEHGKS